MRVESGHEKQEIVMYRSDIKKEIFHRFRFERGKIYQERDFNESHKDSKMTIYYIG